MSYRYKTKSELGFRTQYLEHYKKTKLTHSVHEELHWTLDEAKKNKRTIIYIFANGRRNQVPVKYVLTTQNLRNWQQTLEHMANAIDMPEGINRYIH